MKKFKEFLFLIPLGVLFIILFVSYFLFNDINEFIDKLLMASTSIVGGVFLVAFIVFLIQFIGELSGNIIGLSERKIKQFDKSDFKLDEKYYREILQNYSPLILGYIDDFKMDKNKIISEILYLEMKNLISIEDGKINKVINEKEVNISKIERMFIDFICCNKSGFSDKIYEEFFEALKEQVIFEAEYLSLVFKKENNVREKKKSINNFLKIIINHPWLTIFLPIFICGIGAVFFPILQKVLAVLLAVIVIGPIILAGIWVVISLMKIGYKRGKGIIYKRTKKGQEINQKLEGLKNYLKDYSMLDERESKELELWDEYLIYSVMFGHNQKIIEEYEKYIEFEK